MIASPLSKHTNLVLCFMAALAYIGEKVQEHLFYTYIAATCNIVKGYQ